MLRALGENLMSAAATSDELGVVHPHGCPFCGSTEIMRVSEFVGRFEQPIDRIENFYGGKVGLRACAVPGSEQIETQYGVKTLHLRCEKCGLTGDPLKFVTEIQPVIEARFGR